MPKIEMPEMPEPEPPKKMAPSVQQGQIAGQSSAASNAERERINRMRARANTVRTSNSNSGNLLTTPVASMIGGLRRKL